ncbi:MAG: hypothetical protein IKF64_02275 [Eubacterium sp.]|nr:hypothetical protein [Eubacterium sp.]
MYLTDKVSSIISLLCGDEYFEDKKVIAAFPFAYKPTRFGKIIVTVSPHGIEAENISAGGHCLYGKASVSVDVFVPHETGSSVVNDVIEHIIDAVADTRPCTIKVSPVSSKDELSSYTASCVLTYKSLIEFGGNNG